VTSNNVKLILNQSHEHRVLFVCSCIFFDAESYVICNSNLVNGEWNTINVYALQVEFIIKQVMFCYGVQGYGETGVKSSSTPQEMKPLEGIYIHKVACGWGHTLFIARNESEEDKGKLEALPVYVP